MKARVKTTLDKMALLEKVEIARINKIWMIALHNSLGYTAKGIERIYAEACDIAGKLYEDPEYWQVIDDLLCGTYKFEEFLPREDVDEREKICEELHKFHGKKWRQY